MTEKEIFVQARLNYDYICLMVNNYQEDFQTLVKILKGRMVEDGMADVDYKNITITIQREPNGKAKVCDGRIDVYDNTDVFGFYVGAFTPEEIIAKAIN